MPLSLWISFYSVMYFILYRSSWGVSVFPVDQCYVADIASANTMEELVNCETKQD